MARPFISFLTDFGPDGHAPICRAVMLGIAPDVQIVDIAHSIRKYAVRDAAYLLWAASPYLPVGIHVGVVDPGVGTERRPVALRTGRGDIFVGPDNGLLVPAAERLDGISEVRQLENPDLMLPNRSSTFHGRDVFAPVAAHLAAGTSFQDVGRPLPLEGLVRIAFPEAEVSDGELVTCVLFIDHFGNVSLAGAATDLCAAVGELREGRPLLVAFGGNAGAGRTERTTWQRTFGNVPAGASLLYEDSFGQLALADNQGDVAARLQIVVDEQATVRAA
jgi:S-adenosylmethionine hydrolase